MDAIDQAQDMEQRERDAGIAAARSIPRRIPAGDLCVDCDFEIEQARRKASPTAVRCIGCQEDHEGGAT